MNGPHVTTIKGDRVSIECQNCKTSMDVGANSFLGPSMIENWPKLHKCPKGTKKA